MNDAHRTLADLEGRKMEIVRGYPPNIKEIERVFPSCMNPGVIFAWAHLIYNPTGNPLPIELLAHECVHSMQQDQNGPHEWWKDYLSNPEFMIGQEIEAHQVEYARYAIDHPNRHMKRAYLKLIAKRLSGALYNHGISYAAAREIIKGE